MKIYKLELENFRGYEKFSCQFNRGINIVLGENGVGKTTIIEALNLLVTTKSFKTNHLEELISYDSIKTKISLRVDEFTKYSFSMSKDEKKFSINNNKVKKLSDYIGNIISLLTVPSNHLLIDGQPSFFRNFIDMTLSIIDMVYLKNLKEYQKLVKQKQSYLELVLKDKKIKIDNGLMKIFQDQIYKKIFIIQEKRKDFLDLLNENFKKKDKFNISNDLSIKSNYFKYKDEVLENQADIINSIKNSNVLAKTQYLIEYKGKNARFNASTGQIRMILIIICFSIYEILKKNKSNIQVLLLLDDILTELDDNNKKIVLESIPDDIITVLTHPGIKIDENIFNKNIVNIININNEKR